MRLQQLMEERKTKKGTYLAVKFSDATNTRLHKFAVDHGVPNPIAKEKYHTTIIYSTNYDETVKSDGDLKKHLIGKPKELEVFDCRDGTKALVLLFDCDEIDARHKQLMKDHDLVYDFPDFNSHITLSYDCKDFDYKSIKDFKEIGKIEIVHEYHEDLNIDWIKDET